MVVARRLQSAWIAPLAAWGKTPRSWATAALGLGLIAVAGGEGRTQSGGCARCGPSVMAPRADFNPMFPAFAPQRAERRPPERRTAGGGAYTVCVRACDGAFFPVTYSGAATRADGLENVCRALCPNADVALYSLPFGGTIDEAVSSTGEPYGSLPNAHKFEQAYDLSCSCRAPGQSWAAALAAAEARYGRNTHDVLVSVEDAERMSRPVRDPKAKPAAADAAPAEPPPGLDINGVDAKLSAAAAAMSRQTSGIRDNAERVPSFGLKQGRTVEERGPDGSARLVRVLPAAF